MKHIEAEEYLKERYTVACRMLDSNVVELPFIKPSLADDEAGYFLQAIEQGLFTIDDEGYVQSSMLPPPSGRNTKQKMLPLFWKTPGGRRLFREGVCQMATVASLIFQYGWAAEDIIMEPGIKEFGNLAYGVDILIRSPKTSTVICGEVKKDSREFQKLLSGLHYCFKKGPHAKAECVYKTNHAKYEFCSVVKPSYLFITAPGEAITFSLSYDGLPAINEERAGLISIGDI